MTEVASGIVVVDKPPGWTSHDVVAKVRRFAGTRRVGHAGTLDPMATGVLVIGVERATRLLGYLALHDKEYLATIGLGVTTTTDDAEGEVVARTDASDVEDLEDAAIASAMHTLVGDIAQVPSSVSAIKVDGERAYALVRKGKDVALAARPVRVARFDVLARRGGELDVHVECSTGTYVRALARDLGVALGVGAHLTALRRTRVGGFDLSAAQELAEPLAVVPLDLAVAAAFPRRDLTDDEVYRVARGQAIAASGEDVDVAGAFAPDGSAVALLAERDGQVRSLAVFAPAN